eukprot:COSAG01_NODE_2847_length_6983_cov_7.853574_8_plen_624_part_00
MLCSGRVAVAARPCAPELPERMALVDLDLMASATRTAASGSAAAMEAVGGSAAAAAGGSVGVGEVDSGSAPPPEPVEAAGSWAAVVEAVNGSAAVVEAVGGLAAAVEAVGGSVDGGGGSSVTDREAVLAAAVDRLWLRGDFSSDKEVVLAAVAQSGRALEVAAEELRGDKEFVLAAVAQDGTAMAFASKELRCDRDVVLAAVAQDGTALGSASAELRADKEVVLIAVAQHGCVVGCAAQELQGDRDVVLAAVAQDGTALGSASAELRADKEVVLAAVAQCGRAIRYAAEELRGDREVVRVALAQDYWARLYVAKELHGEGSRARVSRSPNERAVRRKQQERRRAAVQETDDVIKLQVEAVAPELTRVAVLRGRRYSHVTLLGILQLDLLRVILHRCSHDAVYRLQAIANLRRAAYARKKSLSKHQKQHLIRFQKAMRSAPVSQLSSKDRQPLCRGVRDAILKVKWPVAPHVWADWDCVGERLVNGPKGREGGSVKIPAQHPPTTLEVSWPQQAVDAVTVLTTELQRLEAENFALKQQSTNRLRKLEEEVNQNNVCKFVECEVCNCTFKSLAQHQVKAKHGKHWEARQNESGSARKRREAASRLERYHRKRLCTTLDRQVKPNK